MRTHGHHWIDLAMMAAEPHPSPIRRVPSLYNIFDSRAEGMATGMEEWMMHAGLFDDRPRSRELMLILVAQRAARAMGGLMMHANKWTIDEAVEFASKWTPRGWMPEDSNTVWGEQHFYLTQPGYSTSYLLGKHQIEQLMAERALQLGDDFTLKGFMDEIHAAGLIPMSLITLGDDGPKNRAPRGAVGQMTLSSHRISSGCRHGGQGESWQERNRSMKKYPCQVRRCGRNILARRRVVRPP